MIVYLRLWWEKLHTSLWFVPLLFLIAGGALSSLARRIPEEPLRNVSFLKEFLHNAGASHGHQLLSSLLSSMITMTSLAMSLTMVVLTMAVRNLGPRLIPFFMGSRLTQITLGIFMGTIVYLLMTLRVIHEAMPDDAVPHVAITLGSMLVVLSLIMLLFFIHHLGRSIVADEVIMRLSSTLAVQIRSYLDCYAACQSAKPALEDEEGAIFSLSHTGYIQQIDHQPLIEMLEKRHGSLAFAVRPGHFIMKGGNHGSIKPCELANDKEWMEAIEKHISIGNQPTDLQDIEYILMQLVEIGLRAQSAGINDPFTAIRVMDRIGGSLQDALPLTCDQALFKGETARLSIPITGFGQLLDTAFDQFRQSAAGKPDLLIRLLESLIRLSEAERGSIVSEHLLRHGTMIASTAADTITEQNDLDDVMQRFRILQKNVSESNNAHRNALN